MLLHHCFGPIHSLQSLNQKRDEGLKLTVAVMASFQVDPSQVHLFHLAQGLEFSTSSNPRVPQYPLFYTTPWIPRLEARLAAPFIRVFPSVTDSAWETTLACTERALDAKRSCGLVALYSYLDQSLIYSAQDSTVPRKISCQKQTHRHSEVLEMLCEVILSDDVLARLLLSAERTS
jgi:hypothetical protein